MLVEEAAIDEVVDAAVDQGHQVDVGPLQGQLACRETRDVHQVVDDARQLIGLAPDGGAGLRQVIVAVCQMIDQGRSVHDDAQRIAQLVRHHGQELILPPAGLENRLLRLLALGDVPADADHPKRLALFARQHPAPGAHPARLARFVRRAKLDP